MSRRLHIILWPGAQAEAMRAGRRLVRFGSRVVVDLPGAHVWNGYDHALVRGCFLPTHAAWGAGEEALVTLQERETFIDIQGASETFAA